MKLRSTGRTHELKAWPVYFDAILSGAKTFELRRDDRPGGFRVGDVLRLREWQPHAKIYTGRELERTAAYVLRAAEAAQLAIVPDRFLDGSCAPPAMPLGEGWAIIGLVDISRLSFAPLLSDGGRSMFSSTNRKEVRIVDVVPETIDAEPLHDLLSLVSGEIPRGLPSLADVEHWPQDRRVAVAEWANAVLDRASDHADVVLPPLPPELDGR